MENFKITNLELIALCVESEIQFETATCHPEKCSTGVWGEIDHVLNSSLSVALIRRNLASVEDIENITNWKSLADVVDEKECTEAEALYIVKSMLVQETLNNAYFEQLYKKLVNKENGKCYVPESLSLGVYVKWLATPENLKKLQELKAAKIKIDERPLFTEEKLKDFLFENKEFVQEKLKELDELKKQGEKEQWQVKTNALIQQISNNDFRVLKWKEIYKLIRNDIAFSFSKNEQVSSLMQKIEKKEIEDFLKVTKK